MKCTVPGVNAKILGRAIHALGRIGDELYIESLPTGLSFRTVNSTKSAYAMVMFSSNFFSEYSTGKPEDKEGDKDGIKCKIAMKSCLSVFKYPNSMSKQVESCKIKLDKERLVFVLRCRYDIVKTHYLVILDNETLQAVYPKENVPFQIKSQTKVLTEAVSNFQPSEEEVTLEVNSQYLLLRNYINEDIKQKVIRSQLALKAAEFDQYNINKETAVTFSLKEFRAVLNFAEALNLPVCATFEGPGRPIVFVLNNDSTFEANFVMATVQDNDSSINTSRVQKRSHKRCHNTSDEQLNTKNKLQKRSNSKNSTFFHANLDSVEMAIITNTNTEMSDTPIVSKSICVTDQNESEISLNNDIAAIQNAFDDDFGNDFNNSSLVVPASPVQDKEQLLRTVFKRCFEATFDHKTLIPDKSQVYAENSDDD